MTATFASAPPAVVAAAVLSYAYIGVSAAVAPFLYELDAADVSILIVGVVIVGWLITMFGRGRNWARIVFCLVIGLGELLSLLLMPTDPETVIGLFGLIPVALLWTRQAITYFRPQRSRDEGRRT